MIERQSERGTRKRDGGRVSEKGKNNDRGVTERDIEIENKRNNQLICYFVYNNSQDMCLKICLYSLVQVLMKTINFVETSIQIIKMSHSIWPNLTNSRYIFYEIITIDLFSLSLFYRKHIIGL